MVAPIFLQDLAAEIHPEPDDLLLLHSKHESGGPDRQIQADTFLFARDGKIIGGGTLELGGFTNTIDASGALLTRTEMLGVINFRGGAGLNINGTMDLNGFSVTGHRNGVLATLQDINDKVAAEVSSISGTITTLTSELHTLEAKEQALERLTTTLQNEVSPIQSAITTEQRIDATLQQKIADLIKRLSRDETAQGTIKTEVDTLEKEWAAVQSALSSGGSPSSADLAALQAALTAVQSEANRNQASSLNTQNLLTVLQTQLVAQGKQIHGFKIEDHKDASGLFDAIISGENLFLTKEDPHSPTLAHFVRMNYRDGLHVQNGDRFANLSPGQLHLHSVDVGRTVDAFLHHVDSTQGTYSGGGWVLDLDDEFWVEWEHAGATERIRMSDLLAELQSDKTRLSTAEGNITNLKAQTAQIPALQTHLGNLDRSVASNTNKFSDYYTKVETNGRFYTRADSNARYYTRTYINSNYYSHSQSDGRYARIHSHPYLTQAAGDGRYDRKGHTHSYLTQAQGDSRYAPRTHTHTTFGATTFNGMVNAAAGLRVQQSSMFTYNMGKTYSFVNTRIPARVGQAIIILSPTDIFTGVLTASSGNALPSIHNTVVQAKVTSGNLWLWTPKPVGKGLIVLI